MAKERIEGEDTVPRKPLLGLTVIRKSPITHSVRFWFLGTTKSDRGGQVLKSVTKRMCQLRFRRQSMMECVT